MSAAALRRATDIAVGALLLCAALPILAVLALAVLLDSGPPLLHREQRLGRHGVPFLLRKLRCLDEGAGADRGVAPEDDPRVTRVGRVLRRWRLDELPQLLNVIDGSMSLVGPRPLPPRHAAALAPDVRAKLLSVRPGLTGAGALAFLAEERVLAGEPDPEALYLRALLPRKAAMEVEYIRRRTWRKDLGLALRTAACVWSPRARRRSARDLRAMIRQSGHGESINGLPAGVAAVNNAPQNNTGESGT